MVMIRMSGSTSKFDENYDNMRKLLEKKKNKNNKIPKSHYKHHTKKHIEIMKREMKKGKSFLEAHNIAMKEEPRNFYYNDPKKKKEKKDKMSY